LWTLWTAWTLWTVGRGKGGGSGAESAGRGYSVAGAGAAMRAYRTRGRRLNPWPQCPRCGNASPRRPPSTASTKSTLATLATAGMLQPPARSVNGAKPAPWLEQGREASRDPAWNVREARALFAGFPRWMPAGFLHGLFLTHHSPLEGESARRGRKPEVAPVGGTSKAPPPPHRPREPQGPRGRLPPTAAAGAWRLVCRDSPSRGE